MGTEIEIKLRCPDHGALRIRLEQAGARPAGRVLERNHILDRVDGSLRRAGTALRVRLTTSRDDPPAAPRAWLTFKGPRTPGEMKQRPELETEVGDGVETLSLLAALGFAVVLCFEKRRETWVLDNCRIELDELPVLGRFVEIEGPSVAAISAVRDRIGLADYPPVAETYVALLADLAKQQPAGNRQIAFPRS